MCLCFLAFIDLRKMELGLCFPACNAHGEVTAKEETHEVVSLPRLQEQQGPRCWGRAEGTGDSQDVGDSSEVIWGHTKSALPPKVAGKLKYP